MTVDRLLQGLHGRRWPAQHADGIVATADAQVHAATRDLVQGRECARGHARVPRGRVRDARAQTHVRGVERHDREQGIDLLPQHMAIEEPAVAEPGRLCLPRERDGAIDAEQRLEGESEVHRRTAYTPRIPPHRRRWLNPLRALQLAQSTPGRVAVAPHRGRAAPDGRPRARRVGPDGVRDASPHRESPSESVMRVQDALSPWDPAGTDQVVEAHARTGQMVGGTDLPGNSSLNCFAYWRLPTRRQSTFTERGMPA